MTEPKSIGAPVDRADGRLKVMGRAKFSAEVPLTGLAHGVLIQSTIPSGHIKSMDTAAAKAAPGVLSVITVLDAKPPSPNQSIFQGSEIKFSGQHIGIVVAETIEQAVHAAELVRVEYELAKPVTVMQNHLDQAVIPRGGRSTSSKRGDAQASLAQGTTTVHETYSTPIYHHNPMEPHATTAVWDGDHLTVYESTQGIFGTQTALEKQFGLPKDGVRVVAYFIGGGFGCKGMTWQHTGITAYAARELGRPVRLALDRRQMFSSNGHRPTTQQELTLGSDSHGKLLSLKQTAYTSTAFAGEFTEPVGAVPSMLYSCANVDISQKVVHLNTGQPTYMRAPGESSGSVGIESAMDELAHELGIDPIELRLRNYAEIDESNGNPYSSKSLRACYSQGAATFGWSKRNPKPRSTKHGNDLIGFGMASATYPANAGASAATARMSATGSVQILCGTQDIGTGTYTILAQVAADMIGVPVERVRVELGDTNLPPGPHSGGSATAAGAGSAVKLASQALRAKLLAMIVADPSSPLHDSNLSDIQVADGKVTVPGTARADTFAEVVRRSGQSMVEGQVGMPGPQQNVGGQQYSKHSFGAHFVEVHVDEHLGTIRVERYVGAFAAGQILNSKTAMSQFRGGIIFGIGMALFEDSMLDPNHCRFVNSNLAEYHVPTNADVPEIDIIMVPEIDPHINAIGAKGVGEIGIVGATAAIGNAVFNATGKRVRDFPITLDKLL